ncbi:MAG TPA: hypothetical protein VN922_04715 [Bacteroidia bacterium]|nr:hypothetical protein [Bacteroidia bacterium]
MSNREFIKLNLNERADLIWTNGEFVGSRDYYGYKVSLYVLEGLYVEVWYFVVSNKIEKIEPIEDEHSLELYLNVHEILKKINQ